MRTVLWAPRPLPETVYRELVEIIFTSLPPVTLIGVILTAVGILVAAKNNDLVIWALVTLSAAVTFGRIVLILAFRRRASVEGLQDPALWERRYAIGAYVFALVLGAFNLHAIATGDPIVAMLVTSVMFGYGAGIVARLGVRPTVCVISLALAVVPTAIGYLGYAARAGDYYVTAMYAAQALLLIAFAAAGTEAMGHIYRTTLQQLLTRQDLTMLAGQDHLTGLPNRTLLRARLNEGIVQMRRADTVIAFHCLDLDHFKSGQRQPRASRRRCIAQASCRAAYQHLAHRRHSGSYWWGRIRRVAGRDPPRRRGSPACAPYHPRAERPLRDRWPRGANRRHHRHRAGTARWRNTRPSRRPRRRCAVPGQEQGAWKRHSCG